ncbi:hypothetical protein T8K17_01910 [Thalassobaculum sp. OXR-137]|uniref:hypothetical protein n=1 Tax=Thalassobaculum sp. OXR-137 TaxID=3100173 RepID=UPI002AC8AED6|nr:hypothetical protein [Thalassobaculum sp. OXR-137]WPZ33201.1 hypothetical protein T8K17_18405 [Thalassobaculum sp. OXR-137]WPZ34906.1 hypothetical protein T8K17_01910 [Thalassobaculum sp. OXR-137]
MSAVVETAPLYPGEGARISWVEGKGTTAVRIDAVVSKIRASGHMQVCRLDFFDGTSVTAVMDANPDSGVISMTFETADGEPHLVALEADHG